MSATGDENAERRYKTVEAAIVGWKKALVDLSGRNNLLYYRNLKTGTIDLSESIEALSSLLDGGSLLLSTVADHGNELGSLLKRAKTIRKKADAAYEEKGLEPMFIAYGMATWNEPEESRKSNPAAPVCLVPAVLSEKSGGLDYSLTLAGEPRLNPTLLRKLDADFDVQMDSESSDSRLIEASETAHLDRECEWLKEQAGAVPGFAIKPSLVLGTFSYSKLPMVMDLERAGEELTGHDLIAALAGDETARALLREKLGRGDEPAINAPDHTPPALENLVLDADSSQSFAINSVLAGRNAIVQGPPGTGKSQTIGNLIAALVAEGKTVLFVAEKRAAIDAVFKRLNDVGLDHLLLDLHDGQKKRGAFAQEIAEAIDRHRKQSEPMSKERDSKLVRVREELNVRTDAQHRIRDPWNVSVYEARVRLVEVPEASKDDARLEQSVLMSIDSDKANHIRETLRSWFQLGSVELYSDSPVWAGVSFNENSEPRKAVEAAAAARSALAALESAMVEVSSQMEIRPPTDAEGAKAVLELCDEIAEVTASLSIDVFDEDIAGLLEVLKPMSSGALSKSFATITSSEYREARGLINGLSIAEPGATDTAGQYRMLEAANRLEESWATIESTRRHPTLPDSRSTAKEAFEELLISLDRLRVWLPELDTTRMKFNDLSVALDEAKGDSATVVTMFDIRGHEADLDGCGLEGFLEGVKRDDLSCEEAVSRFDHIWLSSILDHLVFDDPKAVAPRGTSSLVTDFRELDQTHIETGAEKIRRSCAMRLKSAREEHPEQDTLVSRQSKFRPRSRKHLAVRRYFKEAPDVVRAAKPCWAMSPLVVSEMLPAEAGLFDVVIFDEASQITPPDAVPAILRGEQLVVAGDSQQLPPTKFFLGTNEEDGDEAENEEDRPDDGTENFESILGALDSIVPARMLTWHYRSEDERLIAFSNAHIYDSSLATFPGAKNGEVINHELVPWEPSISDRANSPEPEVARVVELVLDHAIANPSESLGVIAMGVKHANRISDRLDQVRLEMREQAERDEDARERFELFEQLFAGDSSEPFFVKNLERVQGDERDVILLSIGYGKDPVSGKMRYNFGPVSNEGGERRLNVAASRAKKRMTLISSFGHLDMDDAKLHKRGPQLLKTYLEYADSGGTSLGSAAELPPELNAFEVQVKNALEAEGLFLSPQHGVSGYRIDFAVKDPELPGRYLLAIECDGASYHSSPTARQRDRLRQNHLERLGWRFHRIWSADWFLDKEAEVKKAVESYESALAEKGGSGNSPSPFDPRRKLAPRNNPPHERASRPAVYRSYRPTEIASLIRWIESDTLVRTRAELADETIEELGFRRRGSRIDEVVDAAITEAKGPGSTPLRQPSARVRGSASSSATGQRRSSSTKTTSNELLGVEAARISYQRKGSSGPGPPRVVNPLEFKGKLMWAYCHKIGDIRCFRVDRITSWTSVPVDSWTAPPWAVQVARQKAGR